jgi:methionyl-tRNA formyltransferase
MWTQTSAQIFNLIRAVTDPYPGAFTDVGGARLMVWWAETDSPAVRKAVELLPTDSARLQAGVAKSVDASGAMQLPGTVLSVTPLVISSADGALELTRFEWRGASPPSLRVGQVI